MSVGLVREKCGPSWSYRGVKIDKTFKEAGDGEWRAPPSWMEVYTIALSQGLGDGSKFKLPSILSPKVPCSNLGAHHRNLPTTCLQCCVTS